MYSHMGDSKVYESVYQGPKSVGEITKVGRYLEDLDNGALTKTPTATGYYVVVLCGSEGLCCRSILSLHEYEMNSLK